MPSDLLEPAGETTIPIVREHFFMGEEYRAPMFPVCRDADYISGPIDGHAGASTVRKYKLIQ